MRVFKIGLLTFVVSLLTTACAHKETKDDWPAVQATPAPKTEVKTKIKYVYVESPATVSGTTTAPYERTENPPVSFWSELVKVFWPLLAMMAAGFVLILILLGEHLVLNRLLANRAKRAGLKTQSA